MSKPVKPRIIALRRRKIANGAGVGLDLPNLIEVAKRRQAQTSRAAFRNGFVSKKFVSFNNVSVALD